MTKYFAAAVAVIAIADGVIFLRRPAAAEAFGAEGLLLDMGLVMAFGLQHSGLAGRVSRSLFVATAGSMLIAMFALWRESGPVLWTLIPAVSFGAALLGAAVTGVAASSLNALELLALKEAKNPPEFREPILHRFVRHPIYAGNIVVFFAVPVMTADRLLFAAGMTAYILIGIHFEEQKLLRTFGATYSDYRRRVPMLLPWRKGLIP